MNASSVCGLTTMSRGQTPKQRGTIGRCAGVWDRCLCLVVVRYTNITNIYIYKTLSLLIIIILAPSSAINYQPSSQLASQLATAPHRHTTHHPPPTTTTTNDVDDDDDDNE